MADKEILKAKVLARIDEATPEISGGVAARYNIEEFLNDSLTTLLLAAPLRLLKISKITALPVKGIDGSGTVTLPNDFIRLVCFRMQDWARAVYSAIPSNTLLAQRQYNKYTRGGKTKPVVVLHTDETGSRLEYFSSDATTYSEATYVGKCNLTDLNVELEDPLCWLAASLVLGTTNEYKAAEFCSQRYAMIVSQLV